MAENRSPLKDKPLRNPGQSLHQQRIDLLFDKLMAPMLIAFVFAFWALNEWVRYFIPSAPSPWLATFLAVVALGYMGWQFWRNWPKLQRLKMAEDGEKAVGQLLESLRASGYAVFHDLVGDGFNVDHAIIGPGGVFTIETKTRSKPKEGKAEVSFDGKTLLVAGVAPDRDPVSQAKAQASWLGRILSESTGKDFAVWPVVVFPGWYVGNNPPASFKELWVLEPKALLKFIANEKVQLAPEDVALASSHLTRYIRSQERLRADAA